MAEETNETKPRKVRTFRASEEEWQRYQLAAGAADLRLSDWIRWQCDLGAEGVENIEPKCL
jgi:hypothetical protein